MGGGGGRGRGGKISRYRVGWSRCNGKRGGTRVGGWVSK